jgi:hypothetical protein
MVYVLCMTSPQSVDPAVLTSLFERAVPRELFSDLCREQGWVFRRGIYSMAVFG